jgi:hypothetical protein
MLEKLFFCPEYNRAGSIGLPLWERWKRSCRLHIEAFIYSLQLPLSLSFSLLYQHWTQTESSLSIALTGLVDFSYRLKPGVRN